jgi:ABC-type Na+ efflux pump permease subunit
MAVVAEAQLLTLFAGRSQRVGVLATRLRFIPAPSPLAAAAHFFLLVLPAYAWLIAAIPDLP